MADIEGGRARSPTLNLQTYTGYPRRWNRIEVAQILFDKKIERLVV